MKRRMREIDRTGNKMGMEAIDTYSFSLCFCQLKGTTQLKKSLSSKHATHKYPILLQAAKNLKYKRDTSSTSIDTLLTLISLRQVLNSLFSYGWNENTNDGIEEQDALIVFLFFCKERGKDGGGLLEDRKNSQTYTPDTVRAKAFCLLVWMFQGDC